MIDLCSILIVDFYICARDGNLIFDFLLTDSICIDPYYHKLNFLNFIITFVEFLFVIIVLVIIIVVS